MEKRLNPTLTLSFCCNVLSHQRFHPKLPGLARLRQSFKALQHRNYRLYFVGQGISIVGTWMTQIAAIWLTYHLTNSPFLLGIVGFVGQSPSIVLAPVAGYLGDRWNRRHILLVTQSLALIRSLALAILAFTNHLDVGHLIVLSFIQGVLTAIDLPTRQAFVSEIVETKADLGSAIALNSSLVSGARLLAPAIAGLLLSSVGAGMCFLLDAISYGAVITALVAMKLQSRSRQCPQERHPPWHEISIGFSYTLHSQPIRTVLLLLAFTTFLGTPFIALGPVFADDVLGGNSDIFGFLMTASAIGALIGALYLSSRPDKRGIEKLIVVSPVGLGLGLLLFSQSRTLSFSLLLIACIGLMLVIQSASSNTFIQTIVEDRKRGRVMGFYTLTSEAGIPLGNLFAGILASQIGVQTTLAIEGTLCILIAVVFRKYLPHLRAAIAAAG
ncbi:MAG: MFS transporter [Synechococcales cyanobacterium T60_A2020_003]|nr:MFS transporter [Synechococcales cyanobacterium T60_A2020_003]